MHSGAMIALYPSAEVAAQLQQLVGSEVGADQLHLTLAYLGESAELEQAGVSREQVTNLLITIAGSLPSIAGKIGGIARFTGTPEGDAIVLLVDSPDLPAFRQTLVEALATQGIVIDQTHGFIPHITLQYLSPDEPLPNFPPVELDISFSAICLAWGDIHVDVPLGVPASPEVRSCGVRTPQAAVSALRMLPNGDVEVKGYLAIWGSPAQRDCYFTWFDKENPPEMGLDLLPFAYFIEHNEDYDVRRTRIGTVTKVWSDETGIGYVATLEHERPKFREAYSIIQRGDGYTSSGSADHLARFDEEGRFRDWMLSEVTLTQYPCETRMPAVQFTRHRNNKPAEAVMVRNGLSPEALIAQGTTAVRCHSVADKDARSCSCGSAHHSDSTTRGENSMDPTLESLGLAGMTIDQIVAGLVDTFGADVVAGVYNDVFAVEGAPIDDVATLTANAVAAYPDVTGVDVLVQALYAVIHEMPDQIGTLVSLLAQPEPVAEATPEAAATLSRIRQAGQRSARTPLPKVTPVIAGGNPNPELSAALRRIQQLEQQMATSKQGLTPALPQRKAPAVNTIPAKYDHIETKDLVAAQHWLTALDKAQRLQRPFRSEMKKVLAYRIEDEVQQKPALRSALRKAGISSTRANELMGSTVATAGDEWVGVLYDNQLWEAVRLMPVWETAKALGMIEREIPQGVESITIPTEGSDPTFYVVGQTVSEDATGQPQTKLDSSKPTTGSKSLTAAKLGTAVEFTGELEEDSVIPMVPELLRRMEIATQEEIEYIIINGDTATGANTNINLIDGTPTAATLGGMPSYTLLNGWLKLALVTTATNSFDLSGAPTQDDFLTVLSKMGTNGKDGVALNRTMFVIDPMTYFAVLSAITNAQTIEKFGDAATLVKGVLESIWGRPLLVSGQMALANSAGKIPSAGGTLGRILGVRCDHWIVGFKRRTTTEVTRWARSDATEIVSYLRMGMVSFDNEASAVGYNATV